MKITLSGGVVVSLLAATLNAPHAWSEDGGTAVEEILVTSESFRLPESLSSFPGSVTVLDHEELQKLRGVNDDLGSILGNFIPGISPSGSKTSASNFDQTMRGRKPAVFIDGVPITTPLRDGAQDIRSLHPAAIENIQVIRGSTTLYGNGGAGGVINYITRKPSHGEVEYTTEVGSGFSLTHFSDSVPLSLTQTATGDTGLVDFVFNGHIEQTPGAFDNDGERIPPNPNVQIGLADSKIYNVFGKVGFEEGNHRFELSGLYYEQKQDTDYQLVNGDVSEGIPTSTEPENFDPRRVDPGNENLVINAVYTHADLFGSQARVQAFYQDYESIFEFFADPVFPGDGQPFVEAEKHGLRLDVSTPLGGLGLEQGRLLWGIDYFEDETAQPLVDGRTFVPELTQETVALFTQFDLPVGEYFVLQGGVRWEDISVDVVDYVALFSGAVVTGGEITYNEPTYNVGAVVPLTEQVNVFASFSQGVSVAELGRILRQATTDIDVAEIDLEPSVTDSYEIGVRADYDTWSASAVVFQNESDLGSNVTQVPGMEQFIVSLQPEEIYGFEATFEVEPGDGWRMGGSYSWMKGETDTDGDGDVDAPLTGQRIPPKKLAGYVEWDMADEWIVRVQGTYTGSRNKFPGSTSFGRGKVNSHLVLDLYTRFRVGPGQMSVGIHNLLNEDYFTHTSEIANTDNRYSKATGAEASIKYSITY